MTHTHSFRLLPARRGSMDGTSQPRGLIASLAGVLLRKSRETWTRHRDENRLQALSDHQLRDLGISRLDIGRVVRRGLER